MGNIESKDVEDYESLARDLPKVNPDEVQLPKMPKKQNDVEWTEEKVKELNAIVQKNRINT
jgi:hypothetical protein